ncbi:MAG: hypothetical protein J4G04_00190 [Nitrosopumilaceae archaeon]|nr:hypothetical protein [Nitrosopumilaceae archaeon]
MSERPADENLAKDTQTLLGLGVGDKRILEQIHRAAVNGELISNHERAYVDSLLEKHAGSVPAEDAPAPRKVRVRPSPAPAAAPAKSSSKTIVIAAGAAVAAVAVAAALLTLPGDPGGTAVDVKPVLTVEVDSEEYGAGDFILVEGLSDGGAVDVHIVGPAGQVWRESVLPDADGSFHTIALAGSGGWNAGTYTVRAVHGDQTYESAFDFRDS